MRYKILPSVLGLVLLVSALQISPLAYASNFAGGYYAQVNPSLIGSSANSNVPGLLTATQANLNTSVWQGAYTNTSYFVQEVLLNDYQPAGSSGWQIGFEGFNSAGTKIDNAWTNSLAQPGCTVSYSQSVISTNNIFGQVRQSSAAGCTSMSQTHTFSAASGSYGSSISQIQLYLEWYDTNCSDFSNLGTIYFTNGLVTNSNGQSSTPTYAATSGGCFSATTGSGYVTIS